MGIHFLVKKTVAPLPEGCQQHNSIAEAIADPFPDEINTFTDTADNRVDAGKFGAVKYWVDGGYGGSTVPLSVYNISNPTTGYTIYIVDSGGSTVDSYVNAGGDVEGQYLELPSGLPPFYVVIENTGGGNCDIFELQFSDPA